MWMVALGGEQRRGGGVGGGGKVFQMRKGVVAPNALFAAGIADARDHRRVIELVRIDDAVRQQLAERAQRRFVRDIARGEEQRPILAVQVGKLMFEVDVVMRVAADVDRKSTRLNSSH